MALRRGSDDESDAAEDDHPLQGRDDRRLDAVAVFEARHRTTDMPTSAMMPAYWRATG